MKNGYISPQLIVHGSVEKMTQIVGAQHTGDVLIFNGETLATDSQSKGFDLVS
ncbi:MAG: lasso peptide [Leptolyngbya sp. SIO1D8]|nr:lasso peptide [Leptolyngbya sp. SIO1D8]